MTFGEVWRSLKELFVCKDVTTIMQVKTELQNMKKEGMSITEYMSKMKLLIEVFYFYDCKLSETYHIMHYLEDLHQKFEVVIVDMTSRISQI